MSEDGKTVGFIDIGTNSIHLLVVNFLPGTLGVDIAQEKEMIRMGRTLYSTGSIDDDAMYKLRLVLRRFADYARKHGAEEIIAFATCAAREADNRQAFIDAAAEEGVEIKVIPGEEEARLIRLGVLGEKAPDEKTLLIDIGGGSTEISISRGREILFLDSLPMGAVRYAYGYPFDPSGPLTEEEYNSYQHNVDLHSYLTIKKIKEIGFDRVIGSSGTFETLADICPTVKVGTEHMVQTSGIRDVMKKLRSMTMEQRLLNPKLNPARADIIIAGGAIAEELLTLLGVEQFSVSPYGLKEGMKVDYRLNHGITNISVRESSVNGLGLRCHYDAEHAEFVKETSLKFFDRLSELGLHNIDPKMRQLLAYAAQLHDIGEFICYTKHNINSYYIILNSNLLGFDYGELAKIAIMARYHHKKFPSTTESPFIKHGLVNNNDIRQCILILRMADALDRHRTQIVQSIDISMHKHKLIVELISNDDVAMEMWKLESNTAVFKEIFGADLVVKLSEEDN